MNTYPSVLSYDKYVLSLQVYAIECSVIYVKFTENKTSLGGRINYRVKSNSFAIQCDRI